MGALDAGSEGAHGPHGPETGPSDTGVGSVLSIRQTFTFDRPPPRVSCATTIPTARRLGASRFKIWDSTRGVFGHPGIRRAS